MQFALLWQIKAHPASKMLLLRLILTKRKSPMTEVQDSQVEEIVVEMSLEDIEAVAGGWGDINPF